MEPFAILSEFVYGKEITIEYSRLTNRVHMFESNPILVYKSANGGLIGPEIYAMGSSMGLGVDLNELYIWNSGEL